MLFDKEQVKQFIPHREPFLFIDTIESISNPGEDSIDGEVLISPKDLVGIEIIAHYRTREDHPIFAGHFPGNPILPGVVQVEMMAQAACFAVTKLFENPLEQELAVALMGVQNAKFRKPVKPEMDLKIVTQCSKVRGPVMSFDAKLYCEDELMSECSVLASVKF